jgi:hypothetical protein
VSRRSRRHTIRANDAYFVEYYDDVLIPAAGKSEEFEPSENSQKEMRF